MSVLVIGILLSLMGSSANVSAAPPWPDWYVVPQDVNQLSAPVQTEPADGTETTGNPSDSTPGRVLYEPLGIPCFKWESVEGATKYELQASEVPQDTAIVLDRNNIKQTTYCPTAYDLSGHGIQDESGYYWRVRAYGGSPAAWGDWSSWWGFTRHWANAPTLLLPSATAVLTRSPVLSWTPVDGAAYYKLEISSDPDFPVNPAWPSFTYFEETKNTAYSLGIKKVPNDEDIYWRVRAVAGGNVGTDYRLSPWSDGGSGAGSGRPFGLCWSCNLEPELGAGNERRPLPLTPAKLEDHVNSAYFSWTPAEGAKSYDLEISESSSFAQADRVVLFQNIYNPGLLTIINTNWGYDVTLPQIYWRVRAKNAYNVYGEWNNETPNVSTQFYPEDTWPPIPITPTLVPDLLFPEFYYTPIYDSDVWEDRSIAVPTFMWNQVAGATSYTIQVADNKFFSPIAWTHTTENLSATPTSTLSLQDAGVYYWRVSPDTSSQWSQIWQTRVDQASQVFTPTSAPPRLLHPTYQLEGDGLTYGQQVLEHFPHLDWVPVSEADHYEVQIATDESFASTLEAAETELISFTPVTRYPPDTYYWRVRAEDSGGTPLGTGDGWSEVYHFALMRQFSPEPIYDTGSDTVNAAFTSAALLTEDPLGDQSGGGQYDLTALYTSMDNNFWYFGWAVADSTQPVRFQLYLDPEGADSEGLDTAPYPGGGTLPNSSEPYRPEYVLHWDMFGASGMPTATLFYKSGAAWDYNPLLNIGGHAVYSETAIYSSTVGFVVLAVPHTAIASPATMNGLLVAVNPSTDGVMDTMDLGYVTVSSSPAPRTPPTSHVDDDYHAVYPRMPLITWHTLTNIMNVKYQSGVDVSFSEQTEIGEVPKVMAFSGSNPYYLPASVYPDNTTHYWRVLSRYVDPWPLNNTIRETTWSRPVRFTKRAQVPIDLTISDAVISDTVLYTTKTPVFSWSPVQGAVAYNFELVIGSYSLNVTGISSNFYVPKEAIPNGDCQWNVRIVDGSGDPSEDNYAEGSFHKGANVPTTVFPIGSDTFTDTVYFRWEPLTNAAYYKVQVASDENFSVDVTTSSNINNTIYAPETIPNAVQDGTFYWQVCGYNGNNYLMGCEPYLIELYPESVYLPFVVRNQ